MQLLLLHFHWQLSQVDASLKTISTAFDSANTMQILLKLLSMISKTVVLDKQSYLQSALKMINEVIFVVNSCRDELRPLLLLATSFNFQLHNYSDAILIVNRLFGILVIGNFNTGELKQISDFLCFLNLELDNPKGGISLC